MYKIVLISRAPEAEAMDEAGRCLAMISQASGLDLEIELRDLDDAAARPGLALECLRADAVMVGGGSEGDPDRRALDEKLGLYAEFRPLHPASFKTGDEADLLLVLPYRDKRVRAAGSGEIERLARAAFVAAQRRSNRIALIVDPENDSDPWRDRVAKVAGLHPGVAWETIDLEAALLLVEARTGRFDVILAAAPIAEALQMAVCGSGAPSASVIAGDSGPFVFTADPEGGSRSTITAAALLLWYALDRPELGALLSGALAEALAAPVEPGLRHGPRLGESVQSSLAERLGARSAHLQLMAMNRGCCG